MPHKKTGTPRKKKTVKRRKKRSGGAEPLSSLPSSIFSQPSGPLKVIPTSSRSAQLDRRAMEKVHANVGRLLEEHDFDNVDQANAFLSQFIGTADVPRPNRELTPAEKAQDKMYEAFGAKGERRVELAREALAISADCPDAYVLLAEETAETLEEARELYEQGVLAGERALGEEIFEEAAGRFWGILETRPYMRARAGLAQSLDALGEQQQAIEHYRELLRLNPHDNQGNRFEFARCLLKAGADEELGILLDQYKDDAMAAWAYTLALWLFRKEGASARAGEALKKAFKQNRFVLPYLIGLKSLPDNPPDYMSYGDESEAIDYAAGNLRVWLDTEGALKWLAELMAKSLGTLLR